MRQLAVSQCDSCVDDESPGGAGAAPAGHATLERAMLIASSHETEGLRVGHAQKPRVRRGRPRPARRLVRCALGTRSHLRHYPSRAAFDFDTAAVLLRPCSMANAPRRALP